MDIWANKARWSDISDISELVDKDSPPPIGILIQGARL